jgi:hypothetical protein
MVVMMIVVMVIIVVMAEVNANVEMLVIPIGFVIPAPLTGRVHLGDIIFDLATVLAVASRIAIDPRTIGFQPSMAILFPILVSSGRPSESEHKPAG